MLDISSQTKLILGGAIKDAKMRSSSSDFQTLIKYYLTLVKEEGEIACYEGEECGWRVLSRVLICGTRSYRQQNKKKKNKLYYQIKVNLIYNIIY